MPKPIGSIKKKKEKSKPHLFLVCGNKELGRFEIHLEVRKTTVN